MSGRAPLGLFEGFGIELEYMIVDRATLAVAPLADALLREGSGAVASELEVGELAWSNELAAERRAVPERAPAFDPRGLLSALDRHRVAYIIVGAFAMAAHGLPRATGEIDLWVRPSADNAARVRRALGTFGAPILDLTLEDLVTPSIVFQVGIAPRRIDILTSIDGVDFDEAWEERKVIELEGHTFATLSRDHLLRNKRTRGRPKDMADAAWLDESSDPED